MRRRSLPGGVKSLAVIAVSASLLAAACGSSGKTGGNATSTTGTGSSATAAPAGSLAKGGTLNIVAESDVGNLDTSQEYEVIGWTLFRAITRQLTSYKGDASSLAGAGDTAAVDDLAASHTVSADGLTYTFKLRSGIHYSGPTTRAIKSEDFTYAIKRLCDPNGPSGAIGYYTGTIAGMQSFCDGFAKIKTGDAAAVKTYIDGNQISGITTPDDSTVVFKLTAPAGDFLNILALPFATPEPEEILSKYITDSADMRQNFVSSGPYYLKTYVPGKSMDIERSPNYDASTDPLRAAYVDAIKVNETVGNDDSEFQQIQAGTADYSLDVTSPPPTVIQPLSRTKSPLLHTSPEGSENYIVMNTKTGANADTSQCGQALQKLQVRQAINYAVNKQDIVQTLGGPIIAKPSNHILTSTITGYDASLDPYSTPNSAGDAAKAKSMLAAAGYPNGITCTFIYRTKSKGDAIFATLQQDLAKAGITLKGNEVPGADYYAKHLQNPAVNDWDLAVPNWSPDWQGNGARSFFIPLLQTNCALNTTNYGCFNSGPYDADIKAALASSDPAALWSKVDSEVMAQAPWAPLVERNAVVVVSSRVKGFQWFNFADNGDIANMSVGG